jgi:hypothetical protein
MYIPNYTYITGPWYVTEKLEVIAQLLKNYENLEAHYECLVKGSVKTAGKKLKRELKRLEGFLLSREQQNLNNILTTYARDCEENMYESGSTYRWISIKRASEQHWKTSDEPVLFAQR